MKTESYEAAKSQYESVVSNETKQSVDKILEALQNRRSQTTSNKNQKEDRRGGRGPKQQRTNGKVKHNEMKGDKNLDDGTEGTKGTGTKQYRPKSVRQQKGNN